MTKSLVDNIRQTITPSVVAQLSGTFGESTQAVERGLSGATVAILGIIAARSTDPRFFNQLFSLVKSRCARCRWKPLSRCSNRLAGQRSSQMGGLVVSSRSSSVRSATCSPIGWRD